MNVARGQSSAWRSLPAMLRAGLACQIISLGWSHTIGAPVLAQGADSVTVADALAPVTQKLESGAPLVFATFGDSITWPCFHTDFRQNYITLTVDALRRAYPKSNVRIVHAGNMGTAGRGLDQTRFDRHVLAQRPDVVFLMFGMNDCGGGPGGLDNYDRNLTRLIEKTRQSGALPVVLTQNEIIYESPDGPGRRSLSLYIDRAKRVAAREGTPLVDCFALWKPLAGDRQKLVERLNDWIHPNLAGHRLFAKSIVRTLWPKAESFVVTEVCPENNERPIDRLLPGPAGKQVVRTDDGVWFLVWAKRRGERLTDLMLSFSPDDRPNWSEFEHVTLVGPGPKAVFCDDDRALTAGLLLEKDKCLYVVFSWNTGVYFVSLDRSRGNWRERVSDRLAWLELTQDPFHRPMSLLNSQTGQGVLWDACLQPNGQPSVLCATRKMSPGSGFEIIDGVDGVALVSGAEGKRVVDFLYPVQLSTPSSAIDRLSTPFTSRFDFRTSGSGVGILREQDGKVEFLIAPILLDPKQP